MMGTNTSEPEAPETPNFSAIPFTFREIRFFNHYLEYGNAYRAAKETGLFPNSTDDAIRSYASKLLTKSNISEYLRMALDQFLDR